MGGMNEVRLNRDILMLSMHLGIRLEMQICMLSTHIRALIS